MTQLYDEFCKYLISKKKTSANTLASYQNDIKNFIIFLQASRIIAIESVDINIIDKYVCFLKKEKKSPSTISRNLSSLRCFFKFLLLTKKIKFSPMVGIKNEKKESQALPTVLTNKDVDSLLSCPDLSTVKGIRDKAMLEVLYASGIRVSELLSLKVTDVNLQIGYIIINKSSDKERIIPIYSMAAQALTEYINKSRNELLSKSNFDNCILFLNSQGSEMTRQGFWKIIKSYAVQTGIKSDITPNILRHSFATHLLENGADITVIKDMLGHSTISSTKIYTKVLKNKYKNIYNNCHPRATAKV